MFIIDDILAAKAAGKLTAVLIGASATLAIGFAAAEVYEHKAPWGLAHKRDAAVTNAATWSRAYAHEKRAFDQSERLRLAAHGQAVAGVASASADESRASSDAYETGYSLGRRAGLKACGDSHATDPSPSPRPALPGAPAGVQDDFADSWKPAYAGPAVRP